MGLLSDLGRVASNVIKQAAPVAATVGGGVMTAMGGGALGIPLMMGGLSYMGTESTNATNRGIANDATNANMAEAARNRDFQAQQAQQQMAYQSQMSNTSYQRGVADMQAAGLNPMLAGLNQSGDSSPQGASASGSQGRAETTQVQNAMATALNSAVSVKSLMTEMDQKGSQTALNNALASKALVDAQASAANTRQAQVNTQAVESQLQAIAAKARVDTAKAGYDFQASKYDAIMSRANRDSGTAKNVIDLFKPSLNIRRPKGTYIDGDGAINQFP